MLLFKCQWCKYVICYVYKLNVCDIQVCQESVTSEWEMSMCVL